MKRRILSLFCLAYVSVSFSCAKDGSIHYEYLPSDYDLGAKKDLALSYYDLGKQLSGTSISSPERNLKSGGDLKGLVIPLEIKGYPFAESLSADLQKIFNVGSGYDRSVEEFYKISSFGAISSFSFAIAPIYKTNVTVQDLLISRPSRHHFKSLVSQALTDYAAKNDIRDFDNDQDGYVDAVYFIYSCQDYQAAIASGNIYWDETSSSYTLDDVKSFWSFVATYSAKPNLSVPSLNRYVFTSFDSIYLNRQDGALDARTIIHETSHLFGLSDYYNYDVDDKDYTDSRYKYYSPTGGLELMDYNILDHNAFSKMSLGWIKPYVIDKSSITKPITVEIKDSSSSGDCLLIPSSGWNGSPFDEYLLIELYSPRGLNAADSAKDHSKRYPRGFFIDGIKIYHIDARIVNKTFSGLHVASPSLEELATANESSFYKIAASNTPSQSALSPGYRLIHLLESNGINTFQNIDYPTRKNFHVANNSTLFSPDSRHGNFSFEKFSSFFEKSDRFNDGSSFNYKIRINGIKNNGSYSSSSITIALL